MKKLDSKVRGWTPKSIFLEAFIASVSVLDPFLPASWGIYRTLVVAEVLCLCSHCLS